MEGWTQLTLTTFLYLESTRAQQLARRGLREEQKTWWRHQRTHGLCHAIRQSAEQRELAYIVARLETDGGIQKLKRLLRASVTREYQAKL